jgi:hypothetical protein
VSALQEQHEAWKAARARLDGPPPSRPERRLRLPPVVAERRRKPIVRQVVDLSAVDPAAFKSRWRLLLLEVARAFKVRPADIIGPSRKTDVRGARRELCGRMHYELKMSLGQIAQRVGDRHHTTILYQVQMYDLERGRP